MTVAAADRREGHNLDIRYLTKRLANMNYAAFFDRLDSIHNKTEKSRLCLLLDMLNCAVQYGAGYMDYDLFEMYNLTSSQRDTYITRGRNYALVKKYNNLDYAHCFDNKDEFYNIFSEYIHRDWITLKADKKQVLEFIQKRDVMIAKPTDECCGKGVEKIVTVDYPDPQSIIEKLQREGKTYLLEDVIVQHPQVSRIYPEAINTLRIVTVRYEGRAKIACAYFRIGNNGHCVDNFNSGGMVAPVDELTGVVKDKAVDKNKQTYKVHPYSGELIQGFTFPYWEEAIDMVQRASQVIPQMGYIGWDVAFTPDGPCLVEGNNYPGYDIYQLPEHTHDKHGMYERFLMC